jgi:hypothetical protein
VGRASPTLVDPLLQGWIDQPVDAAFAGAQAATRPSAAAAAT